MKKVWLYRLWFILVPVVGGLLAAYFEIHVVWATFGSFIVMILPVIPETVIQMDEEKKKHPNQEPKPMKRLIGYIGAIPIYEDGTTSPF
jgi:hypothetical protein